MNAAGYMLLFVMLFATFVTLAAWKLCTRLIGYFNSGRATATTRRYWRHLSLKLSAIVRAWSLSGWIAGAFVMFSLKSVCAALGIRSKQRSLGSLVKCA